MNVTRLLILLFALAATAMLVPFDPPEPGTQPLPRGDNDACDASIQAYSSGLGLAAPIKEVDI